MVFEWSNVFNRYRWSSGKDHKAWWDSKQQIKIIIVCTNIAAYFTGKTKYSLTNMITFWMFNWSSFRSSELHICVLFPGKILSLSVPIVWILLLFWELQNEIHCFYGVNHGIHDLGDRQFTMNTCWKYEDQKGYDINTQCLSFLLISTEHVKLQKEVHPLPHNPVMLKVS